jgi:hypothetical protein
MPEVARYLAYVAAVLILVSIAVWAMGLRGPLLQRLDGQRARNAGPAALAIGLLTAALVLSAIAAFLAIVGSISL